MQNSIPSVLLYTIGHLIFVMNIHMREINLIKSIGVNFDLTETRKASNDFIKTDQEKMFQFPVCMMYYQDSIYFYFQ